jgi:hypothetical protein
LHHVVSRLERALDAQASIAACVGCRHGRP